MKKFILTISGLFFFFQTDAQTNILCTNPVAEQVMKGNYNPQNYLPPIIINQPDSIVQVMMQQISPDSLHSCLDTLTTFYTRNSASDTVSATTGIGAARRWAYQKFTEISVNNIARTKRNFVGEDELSAHFVNRLLFKADHSCDVVIKIGVVAALGVKVRL